MPKLVMRKDPGGTLRPVDQAVFETMGRIANGSEVMVTVRQPRNIRHHRKLFALLDIVLEHQPESAAVFKSKEQLLAVLKLEAGYCDVFRWGDGTLVAIAKSIDFATMDQVAFGEFYDRSVNFILKTILPGIRSDALEQEVLAMTGD